jgi:hypothetical protein
MGAVQGQTAEMEKVDCTRDEPQRVIRHVLIALVTTPVVCVSQQCGESWSNDELGTAAGVTICDAGCAMSSVAMVLKTKGTDVNPGSLNSWLRNHGGYEGGDELVWASVNAFGTAKMYNYCQSMCALFAGLDWNGVQVSCSLYRVPLFFPSFRSDRGYNSLSQGQLQQFINQGYGTVVNVRNGGHWVLVSDHSGQTVRLCQN